MIAMHWTHPHHGDVEEHLCEKHAEQLFDALSTVALGSVTVQSDRQSCTRCEKGNVPARYWLPSFAGR